MDSYYVGFLDREESHFLEYCSLCRKTLSINSDIFMYRGDMAFCSQECRQEQIEYDEIKSKSWKKMSSSSDHLSGNRLIRKIPSPAKPYGQKLSSWLS